MAQRMKTNEVVALIKQGASVAEVVLSDIETQQLSFRDALLLAENGFVVPNGNIIYDDAEIEYDADFDDVKWNSAAMDLQDFLASKGLLRQEVPDKAIMVEIAVEDRAVREWLQQNTAKLKRIVEKLVVDLYHTDQILHSK
jgi:hypothetical protein